MRNSLLWRNGLHAASQALAQLKSMRDWKVRSKDRTKRFAGGGTLVESVAAIALILPLVVLVIFVTIEASQAYVICRSLNQGAYLAARELANCYKSDPSIQWDRAKQESMVYSNIRIPNMISSNSQFTCTSSDWKLTSSPPTVRVVVRYLGGQGSPALPSFPNPDPLKLGSSFVISSSATYGLQ